MNYHNKRFQVVTSSQHGAMESDTIFHYQQQGRILTSTYQSAQVIQGQLIGWVDEEGNIDMRYHQIHDDATIRTGTCQSTPEILPDGRIRLHETWQWTSGEKTSGTTILEECAFPPKAKNQLIDFYQEIRLEDERASLAPLAPSHIQELLPIALTHPNLLQYSPAYFGTEDYLKEYILTALEARNNQKRYPFAIFDKRIGKMAGSTSFMNISHKDKRVEIGSTWIGKEFQGTGLNKHMKYLMLSYLFEKAGAERVELKTDSRNGQSRKAISKIGAVYEGELRSHTLMTDGYRRNTVYYSILKEEWESVKREHFSQ